MRQIGVLADKICLKEAVRGELGDTPLADHAILRYDLKA